MPDVAQIEDEVDVQPEQANEKEPSLDAQVERPTLEEE